MKNVLVSFLFKEITFKAAKCSGLPMPESIRSFGVSMGPAASMTSWRTLMV